MTEALFERHRVRADDRPPNVIRLAPAPLYNTYHDCWRAACSALDRRVRRDCLSTHVLSWQHVLDWVRRGR